MQQKWIRLKHETMLFSGYFCNFHAHKVTSGENEQMVDYDNPKQSIWSRHTIDDKQIKIRWFLYLAAETLVLR